MSEKKPMKIGQLPTKETCIKLMQVSFSTPQKNLQVFRYCKSILDQIEFFENERAKLVKKYGDPVEDGSYMIPKCRIAEFKKEIDSLLMAEIAEETPELGLDVEDFSEDKCVYPKEKDLWLSAADLKFILEL